MENKINIAELLKGCPRGMELDCTMYNKVTLLNIDDKEDTIFPIKVIREDGCYITLTKYGQYAYADFAKCVIFPKGKTTWKGFVPPCKFKDGDILTTITGSIFIYKKIDVYNYCGSYVALDVRNGFLPTYYSYLEDCCSPATEEEKQKLFDTIKAKGYHWNAETKTLEKLPKFKVGDKIKRKNSYYVVEIIKVSEDGYYNFKDDNNEISYFSIEYQDYYELVPDKFDINTLVPFESRVLVRNVGAWEPAF